MKNLSRRSFIAGTGAAAVMAGLLTACGKTQGSADAPTAEGSAKSIYVLTPSEDHGWTGSVATFAKAKIADVNATATYKAELQTADSAAKQISELEDILAGNKEHIAGIVIQPMDDTVQSAIQSVVDANIPYVAFDRIIDAVAPAAVSNVKGDNAGIGAGCASYFVAHGLKPKDKVYVFEGDTSSVTTLRNQGFVDYLCGKLAFDGAKIDESLKWTEDDLASITYSGAMNWSRSDTKTAFESLMGDAANTDIKWFYAEDDELAMGIIEALEGGGIADSSKESFLAHKPYITGCGGLDELYEILRGNTHREMLAQLGGLMSVTYSPSMIQLAIQDLVDHLDNKTVVQDHVITCQNVTADNVAEFESFK
ncbi:substrate-binding domain-containing protein [Collinsella sp. zg1085]|uniref:substrate-binding domain-containing protein n=1 Tax=Collinsella sp. zg1085 TaxID=2844380 RepID=UPI001C0CAF4C|nr:substrate-binding domain-containing protein [Collinsella sp. zg1085]QWT18061.1 substrate-binding domain-containing protein [Collinsella sp. zg1085]